MNGLARLAFFALLVRPLVYVLLGVNVRDWRRLPTSGPAIIVANHNSHLDALVLMALMPLKVLARLRPVAAADYFMTNRLRAWFATTIIGIIPISRTRQTGNPLAACFKALEHGDILIVFPEGSRGTAESSVGSFKRGVQVLARKYPDVPVSPVFLHGLGKVLPRGEALLVPFFCDVFVGEPVTYRCAGEGLLDGVHTAIDAFAKAGDVPHRE